MSDLRQELVDNIAVNENTVFLDTCFDSAMVGLTKIGGDIIAIYQDCKIVDILMSQGQDFDCAWYYYENVVYHMKGVLFMRSIKDIVG